MKSYHSLSLCLIITIHALHFFPCCLADIWYTKIRPDYETPPGYPSLLFIDVFGFTENGRLELNISDISFSNSKDLNLSLVGFFFAPRLSMIDGRMDMLDYSEKCYLQSDYVKRLYTFERDVVMNNKTLDFEFSVSEPDVFNLFFQNCLLPQKLQVSMNIRTSMYNFDPRNGGSHNYLSAGKNYLFRIYFILACIYLFLIGFSVHALYVSNNDNCVIPYLMLIFTVYKLLSFSVQSGNLHYMAHIGYAQTLVAVLFTFMSSVVFNAVHPLYVVLILICFGWQFSIPEAKREMCINTLLVIICRILAYLLVFSFTRVHSYSLGGCALISFMTHSQDFYTFFLLLCPIGSTTKHLLQDEQVEGKAALTLRKVKMLRQLYFGVLSYNYFSFIAVTGFEMFALYTKYLWTGVLVEESTILAMFLFVVWIFWPMAQNNFLSISIDEEISAVATLKDWKTCGPKHIFLGCLFSETF